MTMLDNKYLKQHIEGNSMLAPLMAVAADFLESITVDPYKQETDEYGYVKSMYSRTPYEYTARKIRESYDQQGYRGSNSYLYEIDLVHEVLDILTKLEAMAFYDEFIRWLKNYLMDELDNIYAHYATSFVSDDNNHGENDTNGAVAYWEARLLDALESAPVFEAGRRMCDENGGAIQFCDQTLISSGVITGEKPSRSRFVNVEKSCGKVTITDTAQDMTICIDIDESDLKPGDYILVFKDNDGCTKHIVTNSGCINSKNKKERSFLETGFSKLNQ